MPRHSTGPRRYSDRPGWFAEIDGRRIRLGDATTTAKQARKLWRAAMDAADAGRAPEPVADPHAITLTEVADRFLGAVGKTAAASTLAGYRDYLAYAVGGLDPAGRFPAASLKPHHVTAWLNTRTTWGQTTRGNAIGAVKAALGWAVSEGILGTNPLTGYRRPAAAVRERCYAEAEFRAILRAASKSYRVFLWLLWHTGARPSELMALDADCVSADGSTCTLAKWKNRKKAKAPRVVVFPPRCRDRVRKLAKAHAGGPLLRPDGARSGERWTVRTRCTRHQDARRKAGLGEWAQPYALRHTFITRAVRAGIPLATVAKMVGTSIAMLSQRYTHLLADDAMAASERM